MNIQQIIKRQGWEESKQNSGIYELEKDVDTIKIYLEDRKDNIEELKDKLWNAYYSRVLIYKNFSNDYIIWSNSQSPKSEGVDFKEKPFDEKISPIEYWDEYISKTSKNAVDKKLKESILTVFRRLNKEHPKRKDDLISIILACTFVRFLEDRNLTDIKTELVNALESKKETVALFNEYDELHNGILFKNNVLSVLDNNSCKILKSFLEDDLFPQKSFFRFDFRYIPIELISNIYEELLTEKLGAEEKKDQGIAYTPPRLANYVTKQAFKQLDKKFDGQDFSNIKIGDLSVGSGIFLVLSFRELLKRLDSKKNNKKTFKEKKDILENSFYGMDSDESAIKITKFSLYVELLGNRKNNKRLASKNKFPILENIKKDDTLRYRQKDNFFDLVIGNPPWKSSAKSLKKIEKSKFSKDIGNKELAQMFVHIGLKKLKNNGVLTMVLPTATFYNETSFNFRNSILTNSIVKEFIDFSSIRSHIFKNSVETSVVVIEKKNNNGSYIIPMRRVTNKADYLYFNHISGNTNNIDSSFLQSRNDSWQIAIRGGNMAALLIERLNRDYSNIKNVVGSKNITTGYQGTIGETISNNKNNLFSTPLIYDLDKKYYCVKSKKARKSHKLLNQSFIDSECLIISKIYKFKKTNRLPVLLKPKDFAFYEYFIGINPEKKDLLHFLSALLVSRMAMFFINMICTTMPLFASEQKNAKLCKSDFVKIPFPEEYSEYKNIINMGHKLIDSKFDNLQKIQDDIDKEIERIYKISNLEKKVIKQWEVMTERKKLSSNNLKNYQFGFEYMLDSYDLPKPKKWNPNSRIINGVEIISFSENNILPEINSKVKEKISNIIIAKKEMDYEFTTSSRCVIMRREKSNYGFLTGLLDAELILSSL